MKDRSLTKVRNQIRAEQRRDRERLQGAVIGRGLSMKSEKSIDYALSRATPEPVHYRRAGQIALVYLYRDELRRHRGKTFYNSFNVSQAIATVDKTGAEDIFVSRGNLELIEPEYAVTCNGLRQYWLSARALKAQKATGNQTVDMKREELALANNLFMDDANNVAGQPNLWLGAIEALDVEAAREAIDPLEDIIAARLRALPVSLVPWQQ